jgi:acid phosphatase class B
MIQSLSPLRETAERIVAGQAHRSRALIFLTGFHNSRERRLAMKKYLKVLFSILAAMMCTVGFAADKPSCQKTGKNCPMNDNKACNCGKSCDCG